MEEGTEIIEAPADAPPEGGGAPAPGSAPAADDYAGFDEGTKKRVSDIISKRINEIQAKHQKEWGGFGKPDELRQRLTRAEQLEQWREGLRAQMEGRRLPGDGRPQGAPLSAEDQKVKAYIEKMYPGLGKMAEELQGIRQGIARGDQFRFEQMATANRASLKDMALKAGYDEGVIGWQPDDATTGRTSIEQLVADSIRGNRADHARYLQTGDPAIVRKHFEIIDRWAKGLSPKPPAAPAPGGSPQYAAAKAGAKKTLPPRQPAAGVPAPTAGTRKMTDDERRSAAFNAIKGL